MFSYLTLRDLSKQVLQQQPMALRRLLHFSFFIFLFLVSARCFTLSLFHLLSVTVMLQHSEHLWSHECSTPMHLSLNGAPNSRLLCL